MYQIAAANRKIARKNHEGRLCNLSCVERHGYTHLTDQTKHHAIDRINGLMDSFSIDWGKVK